MSKLPERNVVLVYIYKKDNFLTVHIKASGEKIIDKKCETKVARIAATTTKKLLIDALARTTFNLNDDARQDFEATTVKIMFHSREGGDNKIYGVSEQEQEMILKLIQC
ncbi:MAG: hypothetical protein WCG84_02935 [Candidatus Moraniibacteriota bacterium]